MKIKQTVKIVIPLNPRTKKNSQQIYKNHRTQKSFITQSDVYKQYEKDCGYFLKPLNISYPVNIKALYFRKTNHRVDISNLHSALHDILVVYEVIQDDNFKIVKATDGSRVYVDRENPRTEIYIEPFEED